MKNNREGDCLQCAFYADYSGNVMGSGRVLCDFHGKYVGYKAGGCRHFQDSHGEYPKGDYRGKIEPMWKYKADFDLGNCEYEAKRKYQPKVLEVLK